MGRPYKDITDQRFGRLTAIRREKSDIHRNARWLCKCDCGNFCFATINALQQRRVRSCGCLRKERYERLKGATTTLSADVVEVVRCKDCIHAEPISKNADLNYLSLLHCKEFHGEEAKNVWVKYQKKYVDYSIVEFDDYCSYGERKNDG